MSAQGGYSNKYGNTRSFGPCFENHYSAQGHKTLDQTTLDTAILNSVRIRFNISTVIFIAKQWLNFETVGGDSEQFGEVSEGIWLWKAYTIVFKLSSCWLGY